MSLSASSATSSTAGAPCGAALVTGAARRLGREIALTLARAGWDIAVHYSSSRDEALQTVADIQALGRRAVALQARLEDEAEVLALLPAATQALGPVRCLVNNASRFVFDAVTDLSFDSFTQHMLPNLAAPIVLARELHRQLPAGEGSEGSEGSEGIVINLLDQKLYGLNPDFLSYTLSKAGLAAANTMLAQALAPRVRVVGIAPGLTLPSYLQDDAAFAHAHRTHAPLGRSSTAEDIAAAVAFAVATRSMTGSVIVVDGGQHIRPLPRDVSLMDKPL